MNSPHETPPVPDPAAHEKPMGFWDHVADLRWTIIKSAAVFTLFVGLIAYNLKAFHRLLLWPFYHAAAEHPDLVLQLGTSTMMEGFNAVFQACLFGGLMLSAPFVLFFVGQFLAPALTARETKAMLPLCTAACGLFLVGASFGFFILLPAAIEGLITLNELLNLEVRWNIGSYYSLLLRSVFGVGGAFQFPLVIVLLSWLGLVQSDFMRRHRRYAIVGIFVVAAVVTPSEDPFILCLMAAPLYALYEIGVVIAARVEKRRERSGAAVLLALLALWPQRRQAGVDVMSAARA